MHMSNPYQPGPKLAQIQYPEDLRQKFQEKDLKDICSELRQFIVDVVSEKGGHFGAEGKHCDCDGGLQTKD
jgi:1-deoxy-D-xylulose-5-phosphate synthase